MLALPLLSASTRPGRGTVAGASSRIAACAGAAVAVVLIGAPGAAVAVADGGGSGSHSNRGGGGNQSDGNGGGDNSGGGHAADKKPKSGNQGPRSTVGSGRNATAGGGTWDDQAGERSGPRESTAVDRSGSSSGTADPAPAPPTVTFGDGRSPHYLQPVGPPRQSSAPTVAPAPGLPPTVVALPPPVIVCAAAGGRSALGFLRRPAAGPGRAGAVSWSRWRPRVPAGEGGASGPRAGPYVGLSAIGPRRLAR
jgi:hypothetical protein